MALSASWELPPRARRIQTGTNSNRINIGTTSACAENTGVLGTLGEKFRNYLRVRGEYELEKLIAASNQELPPRARRIQIIISSKNPNIGTTSACAENTGRST